MATRELTEWAVMNLGMEDRGLAPAAPARASQDAASERFLTGDLSFFGVCCNDLQLRLLQLAFGTACHTLNLERAYGMACQMVTLEERSTAKPGLAPAPRRAAARMPRVSDLLSLPICHSPGQKGRPPD